jgi:diadenosine tetraphosphatase ApaH/serine/threonine PP2A family protein phosphatase
MRTLIISDVHANLTALNAVLGDAGTFERVWCLGDIVGYGPDPNECIERIAVLPGLQCLKGNHDAAILGEIPVHAFNDDARASLHWLETELNHENRQWLAGLDERLVMDGVTLAHGSPRNPVWEYIMGLGIARENMRQFDTQLCLVGHTHLPGLFQMAGATPLSTRYHAIVENEPFTLEHKSILNPGSVGQPRDRDPRSAYLIYDDEDDRWSFHRVAYDVKGVQERIFSAGLPGRHAHRLAEGW